MGDNLALHPREAFAWLIREGAAPDTAAELLAAAMPSGEIDGVHYWTPRQLRRARDSLLYLRARGALLVWRCDWRDGRPAAWHYMPAPLAFDRAIGRWRYGRVIVSRGMAAQIARSLVQP